MQAIFRFLFQQLGNSFLDIGGAVAPFKVFNFHVCNGRFKHGPSLIWFLCLMLQNPAQCLDTWKNHSSYILFLFCHLSVEISNMLCEQWFYKKDRDRPWSTSEAEGALCSRSAEPRSPVSQRRRLRRQGGAWFAGPASNAHGAAWRACGPESVLWVFSSSVKQGWLTPALQNCEI